MPTTPTTRSAGRRAAARRRRLARRSIGLGLVLFVSSVGSAPSTVFAEPSAAVVVTGLRRGDRGDGVRQVQQALVDHGVTLSGGVDGVFGPGTEAALRSFQEQQGLAVSGSVDTATALALGLASSPVLELALGASGDAVATLQRQLIEAGIAVAGGVDGVFGPATERAVKAFQEQRGLAATGTVDGATAGALVEASSSDSTPPTDPPTTDPPTTDPPPTDSPATDPPASTDSAPLVGLKIGSRGDAVAQLQRMLMAAGFDVIGGADGIFGVLTANALSSFQYSVGLPANARADAATVDALTASAGDVAGRDEPPTASTPTTTSTGSFAALAYGARGDAVKEVQRALMAAGIVVRGGADGVYGSATVAAVKSFQTAKGLSATGSVDQSTADALAAGGSVQGVAKPNVLVGLRHGSLGAAVKELQEALIKAGVTVRGGADGIFGPATKAALVAFQESQGLAGTGVVDDATLSALANPKAPVTPSTTADGFAVYGERGARVSALQSALVAAGIPLRGGVDGDFGSGTSGSVMEFQRRHGIAVTGKVDAATAAALGLAAAPKPAPPDPAAARMAAFPVQAYCQYADTFGFPRAGGRVHLGVDILANRGREIYAVADGRITKIYNDYPGSLSGNGVRLTAPDGTYYFYAHMDTRAPGIDLGSAVRAGQVIGYVGDTGNTSAPHLHFEVHPDGGAAVNPYPLVKAIDRCKA